MNVRRVEHFILHWDTGDYDVEANWRFLEQLQDAFPYEGRLVRGGATDAPLPPVSWSKGPVSLEFYFTEIWGAQRLSRALSIPAWIAEGIGIDLEALGEWFIRRAPSPRNVFRAERLASFREVVTLYVPLMTRLGTLRQTPRGVVLRRRLRQNEATC